MSKVNKQKVIDFMSFLRINGLIKLVDSSRVDGNIEISYEPARGVSLHYKDCEVLQIIEFGDVSSAFMSAMVIAADGAEHMLEEDITAKNLKKFEAFKKFKLPV